MFSKIVGGFVNSNTGSFTAWLVPLLVGIFTDPTGYLSSHPKVAATVAAVGLVGQGLYKLWTLWVKHSTPVIDFPKQMASIAPAKTTAAQHQTAKHSKK